MLMPVMPFFLMMMVFFVMVFFLPINILFGQRLDLIIIEIVLKFFIFDFLDIQILLFSVVFYERTSLIFYLRQSDSQFQVTADHFLQILFYVLVKGFLEHRTAEVQMVSVGKICLIENYFVY